MSQKQHDENNENQSLLEALRLEKTQYFYSEHPNSIVKSVAIIVFIICIWYLYEPKLALILAAFIYLIRLDSRFDHINGNTIFSYLLVICSLLAAVFFSF